MARTRTLLQLATDALRLADLENATSRFPTGVGSEVYEYVNKGLARVYAEIIKVQDRPFYLTETPVQIMQSPPLGGACVVPLPLDYMQLVGVNWASGVNGPFLPVEPYQDEGERARLLTNSFGGIGLGGCRFRYGFAAAPAALTQGTIATTYSLEILPTPPVGSWLRVRYVPTCPRLVNDLDTFDGILGFEDAAATWAAILMRRKDDLETAALQSDWGQHLERIQSIARRRDRSRPPKTQIIRGWGMRGFRGRGGLL